MAQRIEIEGCAWRRFLRLAQSISFALYWPILDTRCFASKKRRPAPASVEEEGANPDAREENNFFVAGSEDAISELRKKRIECKLQSSYIENAYGMHF